MRQVACKVVCEFARTSWGGPGVGGMLTLEKQGTYTTLSSCQLQLNFSAPLEPEPNLHWQSRSLFEKRFNQLGKP
jgi:hypothetical protein